MRDRSRVRYRYRTSGTVRRRKTIIVLVQIIQYIIYCTHKDILNEVQKMNSLLLMYKNSRQK